MLTASPYGASEVCVTYDAFDRAVEAATAGSSCTSGATYTQFVYDPLGDKLGIMNGQTVSRLRVPLPGGGFAIYGAGGALLRYWHADGLGNIRLYSNPNPPSFYGDTAFAPFGEAYAGSTTPGGIFAGLPADTVYNGSVLGDALFREFDTLQGRWLSPDPAGLAAADDTNPQTFNRYAYVINNPASFIDPSGLNHCTGVNLASCRPPNFGNQPDPITWTGGEAPEPVYGWIPDPNLPSQWYPGPGYTISVSANSYWGITGYMSGDGGVTTSGYWGGGPPAMGGGQPGSASGGPAGGATSGPPRASLPPDPDEAYMGAVFSQVYQQSAGPVYAAAIGTVAVPALVFGVPAAYGAIGGSAGLYVAGTEAVLGAAASVNGTAPPHTVWGWVGYVVHWFLGD
jgi:RHS repeat-associated protein